MEELLETKLKKQKGKKKIEINMDLKKLLDVANQTELILGGNYPLPDKEEISYVQELYIEIFLLKKIILMLVNIYKISTPNSDTPFSKKETSYQYIKTLKNILEEEYKSKISKIKRLLSGKKLMPHQLLSYEYGKNMDSWAREIKTILSGTTSSQFENLTKEEKIKNVIDHIRWLSIIMTTSYSKDNPYTYVISFSPDIMETREYIHGEYPKQEKDKDIVDAALTYARMEFENKLSLKEFISSKNITDSYMVSGSPVAKTLSEIHLDIDRKYQTIHSIEKEKLKKLYEEKFQYLESKLVLTKINEYLKNNRKLDCKEIFESICKKIEKELSEIESKLKEVTIKIEEINNLLEKKLSNNKDNNLSKKTDDKAVNIEKKESHENSQKSAKVEDSISLKEKEKYEYYAAIREKVDRIVERKNSYKSEEMFKADIVYELSEYGLGITYEEVIKNFQNMREELEVTKTIKKLMDDVDKSLELYTVSRDYIEENGLTVYENRVIAKMYTLLDDDSITDELKKEIEYYLKKYRELVDEIKFVLPAKNAYINDIWAQMINSIKERKYFNTIFIEKLNLYSKTNTNSIKNNN